jgi:hypothetical protein
MKDIVKKHKLYEDDEIISDLIKKYGNQELYSIGSTDENELENDPILAYCPEKKIFIYSDYEGDEENRVFDFTFTDLSKLGEDYFKQIKGKTCTAYGSKYLAYKAAEKELGLDKIP